jgi:hypothetical protein
MGGTLATKGRESDKIVIKSGMNKRIKKNELNVEDSRFIPCRLTHSYWHLGVVHCRHLQGSQGSHSG